MNLNRSHISVVWFSASALRTALSPGYRDGPPPARGLLCSSGAVARMPGGCRVLCPGKGLRVSGCPSG